MGALRDLRGFGRYARALGGFLSTPLAEDDARRMIARNLSLREESFLILLERGVLANGRSPYRRLLEHAGIEYGDVAGMVRADGLDTALARLHAEGVWLSLAEAKRKQPVRRGHLEFLVGRGDLNNRLAAPHIESMTGGSRSSGARFWVDLEDVLQSSAYPALVRAAHGLEAADGAIWMPAPPGAAGIRRALWWTKAGTSVGRWFAQAVPRWRPGEVRRAAFVRWTAAASRRAGRPIPLPEHTSPSEAARVAEWLAGQVAVGRPGVLFATPSSGVRVCAAAEEVGLDLTGTFLSFGGEPYTEAKARAIRDAGCRAESSYYMSELGPVAVGCPNATTVDEAHLAEDRVAVIETERPLANGGAVRPLYVTTVSPLAPQVAINLETGDYATPGRRGCGCPFDQVGLRRTVHTIRSYEKLSTEGMHFFGPRLVALLEDELPRRFGGGPTDYQLVEEEGAEGRSRISLAVSPRLGPLDEGRMAETALDFLGSGGAAEGMMAEIWTTGGTLRVVRREPEVSAGAKVLPLHVSRPPAGGDPG